MINMIWLWDEMSETQLLELKTDDDDFTDWGHLVH